MLVSQVQYFFFFSEKAQSFSVGKAVWNICKMHLLHKIQNCWKFHKDGGQFVKLSTDISWRQNLCESGKWGRLQAQCPGHHFLRAIQSLLIWPNICIFRFAQKTFLYSFNTLCYFSKLQTSQTGIKRTAEEGSLSWTVGMGSIAIRYENARVARVHKSRSKWAKGAGSDGCII